MKETNSNKYLVLILLFGMLVWAMCTSIPAIIFYFDQVEGEAQLEELKGTHLNYSYFHKKEDKIIKLRSKISYKRHQKKLKAKEFWPITYSQTFPNRVSFHTIDPKPSLVIPLLLLFLIAIPLIWFKNIKF